MKSFEFTYVGQIESARHFVIKNNLADVEDAAKMTGSDLARIIGKYANENDYEIVMSYDGQSIGLIPINDAIWFHR